jgi:glycosyltransferase involved in cell wall biosynthesis
MWKKGKEPLRLLVLGDYGNGVHTGYATVLSNLVHWWKIIFQNTPEPKDLQGLKLHICAINYAGNMYQEDHNVFVFSAVKSTPLKENPESRDDFGRNGFLWILKHSNDDPDAGEDQIDIAELMPPPPGATQAQVEEYTQKVQRRHSASQSTDDPYPKGYHGIFIIQDAPVITQIVPLLQSIKSDNQKNNLPNFKSIFYFPCDNPMIEPMLTGLEFFDHVVTYNEYSRQAILNHKPGLRKKLSVIPHGINTSHFYPLYEGQRHEFRKQYFGDNAGKFIILNVNRNQPRKDIPCTIFGFIEFKKKNPDAFLYLHMNPEDPQGWQLRLVMMQTDLREGVDYMFPPKDVQNHDHSIEDLNNIYNACDVYVTTTLGEGWGLGVTEAMSCALPVICPMHTSFMEIGASGERVYALENLYPICNMDNVLREQCDYQEVAEKLQQVRDELRDNPELVQEKINAALQYVATLNWQGIAQKFADIMIKTY